MTLLSCEEALVDPGAASWPTSRESRGTHLFKTPWMTTCHDSTRFPSTDFGISFLASSSSFVSFRPLTRAELRVLPLDILTPTRADVVKHDASLNLSPGFVRLLLTSELQKFPFSLRWQTYLIFHFNRNLGGDKIPDNSVSSLCSSALYLDSLSQLQQIACSSPKLFLFPAQYEPCVW